MYLIIIRHIISHEKLERKKKVAKVNRPIELIQMRIRERQRGRKNIDAKPSY